MQVTKSVPPLQEEQLETHADPQLAMPVLQAAPSGPAPPSPDVASRAASDEGAPSLAPS
jgi:hypothetical protein